MPKRFFDTNVLIYSVDVSYPKKQATARNLLQLHQQKGEAVISTQVLQEFYVAATKKLGISSLLAKTFVEQLANAETVRLDTPMISRAIDISTMRQISFWDALVVSAAKEAHCVEVFTEDLQNGALIEGIRVINPFWSAA